MEKYYFEEGIIQIHVSTYISTNASLICLINMANTYKTDRCSFLCVSLEDTFVHMFLHRKELLPTYSILCIRKKFETYIHLLDGVRIIIFKTHDVQ